MAQGLSLLDQALDLARQEMIALEDGAYDRAMALAEKRNEVTSMAWYVLESSHADEYRGHLVELARVQEHLTGLAIRARDALRQDLQRSRLERQRMNGYHQSIGQALQ
ncbi:MULTISPECIES: hypothetical protein [unclassified Desulfovibrio]|uniref:hypothetical protein n=1 Tax=unclassified Desulfovibrio TaxID=2593640 RepID=UPI002FDAFDC5